MMSDWMPVNVDHRNVQLFQIPAVAAHEYQSLHRLAQQLIHIGLSQFLRLADITDQRQKSMFPKVFLKGQGNPGKVRIGNIRDQNANQRAAGVSGRGRLAVTDVPGGHADFPGGFFGISAHGIQHSGNGGGGNACLTGDLRNRGLLCHFYSSLS